MNTNMAVFLFFTTADSKVRTLSQLNFNDGFSGVCSAEKTHKSIEHVVESFSHVLLVLQLPLFNPFDVLLHPLWPAACVRRYDKALHL